MSYRVAAYVSLARAVAQASPLLLEANETKHKGSPQGGTPDFYFHIGISVALVLLGGVFAGLTLGLMGLDELHLRVLRVSSDDPQERANAAKVLSLLGRGRHWVLVVSYCRIGFHESVDIRFQRYINIRSCFSEMLYVWHISCS
jgi:hypothetical protein